MLMIPKPQKLEILTGKRGFNLNEIGKNRDHLGNPIISLPFGIFIPPLYGDFGDGLILALPHFYKNLITYNSQMMVTYGRANWEWRCKKSSGAKKNREVKSSKDGDSTNNCWRYCLGLYCTNWFIAVDGDWCDKPNYQPSKIMAMNHINIGGKHT